MKMIIGGAVAFLLGIYSIIIFFASFLDLMMAVVPVTLVLAGGLMVYLNRDNLLSKDGQEPEAEEDAPEEAVVVEDDVAQETAPEAPVTEEPVAEEPVAEEPVVEQPVAEENAPKEAVASKSEFVGNTDSKVFHTQDCKFAQSKKCTDFFEKKEAAVQAGYKPCGRCKP